MSATSSESPVGTPDELRVLGKSLLDWGTCGPRDNSCGRGCNAYHRCIFAQPENGAFRDSGPRNVGVLKVNNELGNAIEDIVPCFVYMNYMHDHNQGDSVMKFAVIAQEGEKIHVDDSVPVDPNSNKTGNIRMRIDSKDIKVPAFPRPGMPGSKIEPQGVRAQATLQRHAERIRKAKHEAAMVGALANLKPAAGAEPEAVFVAASPSQMVPDLPTPPSIPKRRGRPPKAR